MVSAPIPHLMPGAVMLADDEDAVRLLCGDRAVVLAGLTREVAAGLRPGRPLPRTMWEVASQLIAAGLASPGPPPDPLRSARIRLLGSGTLARAVADALVESGCGELMIFDNEPPPVGLYPGITVTHGAQALQRWLDHRTSSTTVRTISHWTKPELDPPDLTVVASMCREPDRAVLDRLAHDDQPHLVLRPHGAGVVVGPLVEPGCTPCVRCLDLGRTTRDPAWPRQLAHLCRHTHHPEPVWARWAAGEAVRAIWMFLAGQPCDLAGQTIELEPATGVPVIRAWPRQPECGCAFVPA